ncbi:maltoporin [Mesoterricola sediminis]|uniref:Maltoporin n=1 Tax=Mesoterricola sediminis TaxID=2927980 RepID=A0AA48GQQ3_9BACT|nr:carbohydrate porin [Mesoterricola sediminis]BDU75849.1 maltoporin [Mesoterricola sediminis]
MKTNLLLALPLALAAGSLAAQDTFELHGYMRSGVGRSSNGGEQETFYLANTGGSPTGGPGYRLGNETDNYLELAFDVRAYDKGETSFKLHFRPSFRGYYQVRDSSADAGGDVDNSKSPSPNQQVWIREAWGEATGVLGNSTAFRNASIWAGRRFYMRQDLHMRDQWYWNNSGDGVGIEGINLGFAKLHYAFIQHDSGNVSNDWNNGAIKGDLAPYSQWVGGSGHFVIGSHDLRLSDIALWQGGSLTVGYQYNDAHGDAKADAAGMNNKGHQYHVMLNQSNFFGGDNRVYATYGDGNTFWNWYNPEVKTENTWWHVMDAFYIKPVKNLELGGVIQYRKQDGKGSMKNNTNSWLSYGIRPVYFFTKHFSVAAEIGYDKLKFDNETEDRHLWKQTLALQWSPQASWWSRPSIRVFVTRGQWNANANQWNKIAEGHFGAETQGVTFGAQIEAWW